MKREFEVNLVAYIRGKSGQPAFQMQIYVDTKDYTVHGAVDLAIESVKSMLKDDMEIECNGVREMA
jgi:hypothetical protein